MRDSGGQAVRALVLAENLHSFPAVTVGGSQLPVITLVPGILMLFSGCMHMGAHIDKKAHTYLSIKINKVK